MKDLAQSLAKTLAADQASVHAMVTAGLDGVWRAADTVDNGVVVTSWPALVGGLVGLRTGTGQPAKIVSSSLGGRFVVPFNGLAAAGGYLMPALAALPTDFTFAVRCRYETDCGAIALFDGAVANTGTSQLQSGGQLRARFGGTAGTTTPMTPPFDVVHISVVSGGNLISSYVNSATPVTAAGVSAMSTRILLGALDQVGTFTFGGQLESAGYAARALSAAAIAPLMRALCAEIGITVP